MEKTVLTKEEVEALASLQQQQNDLVYQLGQVEYQLGFFERQKLIVRTELEAFEKRQQEQAQKLEEKYGQGTINLESGEFIKA
jgi:hypothetical protein